MQTSNGFTVLRIKNPCPKRWSGAWFSFVRHDNRSVGQANWRSLASYIGNEAYEEVKQHFACLRPNKPPKYINLKLYVENTPHNRHVLYNLARMAIGFIRERARGNYGLGVDDGLQAGGVASGH